MLKSVKTISIQNPRVIEQVNRMRPSAGRSMTEAAENLILDGIERRLALDGKRSKSVKADPWYGTGFDPK